MAHIINLQRRTYVFALDDSEGSPEFTLDLSDTNLDRLRPIYRKAYAGISLFLAGQADKAALSEAYESVIVESLGEDALQAIMRFIGAEDVDESTVYLAPVVKCIFNCYANVEQMNRLMFEEKYLEPDRLN